MIEFQQLAAALYLAAGVGGLLGLTLPAPGIARGAVWGLALGVAAQAVSFATLHLLDPTPPLTDPGSAVSITAWIAVCFVLVLMWRFRVASLTGFVGPMAFLAVFYGAHRMASVGGQAEHVGPFPHVHVLLASAGLGTMAVAGLAGLCFLLEHRRLKAKRPPLRAKLPSLEALDRVNVAALTIGFPLLTLGVITGVLWVHGDVGKLWQGTTHEMWTIIAWAIYAGLSIARFAGRQGARQAAASAVGGFAFLLFAVVGVEMLV